MVTRMRFIVTLITQIVCLIYQNKLPLTDIFIGLLYSIATRISYASTPNVQTEHILVLLTAFRSEC